MARMRPSLQERDRGSIRPIHGADLAHCRTVFENTTSEDRYCRFFQFKDDLGDEELRRFVEFGDEVIGLLAFEGAEPVGMAHAWIDEFGAAELGIIVSRTARRRGVGRNLIQTVIEQLVERNALELFAYALGENAAFDALARRIGMARMDVDGGVVTFRLTL